jgi:hypothetical protein
MSDPTVSFTVTGGYIELPVDVDPDTLVADQLDAIAASYPGWVPSEGHLEVALLEAFAQMAAETAQVAAQVPIAIFMYFGQLVGILPEAGVAASAPSTWTAVDDAGYTVPAGTQIGIQVTGTDLELFETVADAVIPPGETSVSDIELVAINVGTADNGIEASPVVPVDTLAFLESIATTDVTSGGIDPETQDDYINRLSAELQLLTPRPILPSDFSALAPQTVGVFRALTIDGLSPGRSFSDGVINNTSPTLTSATAAFTPGDVGRSVTGTGIPSSTTISAYVNATTVTMSHNATASHTALAVTLGDLTGQERTVTVCGVDTAGAALSGPIQAALQTNLEALREINFVVDVIAPTFTEIDVSTTVIANADADETAVQAAIVAALQEFLSPAIWGGGDQTPPVWSPGTNIVRYLDLATVIRNIPGVAYISALQDCIHGGSLASVDVTLPGDAPLPQPGTLTVIVT